MVREVPLAVQSILCRAHLPGPGRGLSARSSMQCRGSPGPSERCWDLWRVLSPLQPPGWQQTLQPGSWPMHSSAVRGSEAGSILNKGLRNSRGLHWHEEVLPVLKTVFPGAHAMIRLYAHIHREFAGL